MLGLPQKAESLLLNFQVSLYRLQPYRLPLCVVWMNRPGRRSGAVF
jgi:hypothetical protein